MEAERNKRQRIIAENALKENEKKYREFVEGTDNLITQVDANGCFTYVNHMAREIYGMAPDQCVGKLAFEFIHPEDRIKTVKAFEDWIANKIQRTTFENRQISPDGHTRNFNWTINFTYDDQGELLYINSIAQNITDLKRVEKELRQARDELEKRVEERTRELLASNRKLQKEIAERKRIERELILNQERLNLALDATSDGLWDWNLKTNEVFFSPKYYTMLGYEPYEFPASFDVWKRLLHPEDKNFAVKRVNDHISGRDEKFHVEFRLKSKKGDWIWILSRGKTISRDAHGNPDRMIGTHVDISVQKSVEDKLMRQTGELNALFNLTPSDQFEFFAGKNNPSRVN